MFEKTAFFTIVIISFVSVSHGVIILQEDFETGIDGQSFPGWFFPTTNQIITENGIDGKSLMIYRNAPELGDGGIKSPDFTSTFGLIEFDLMIDTPCVFHTDTDTEHGGISPEGVVFYSDGSIAVGTPAGILYTYATWTENQPFTLGVLSLEEELYVYINNVEIKHIIRNEQYSNLPVESFYFTYGSGGIAEPGTIMIDNVLVVPEPATILLLTLGCFALRRRAKI
jgi:hypothetical protein